MRSALPKLNRSYAKDRAMTCKEVAEEMGNISEDMVHIIEKKALKKLRRSPILFLAFIESLQSERRSNNVGTLLPDEAFEPINDVTK